MTMSDPIADMLTRIRNANTAKHDTVDVPASKMKLSIAEILLKEGYIKNYEAVEVGGFNNIHITLKSGLDLYITLSDVYYTAKEVVYGKCRIEDYSKGI